MIELRDVCLAYESDSQGVRHVLEGINVRVAASEFVCVLGPSGCGKTSLLNVVAGFTRPSAGHILFNNAPVIAPGPERGVVFQDPTLFPWLTVRQNVAFGLRCSACPPGDIEARTTGALLAVGMQSHADAYPHTLSGGMRQRIAIARVLALEPEALLMDEPFSALDANTRERLQDELLRIWSAHRRTVLYVTHSVEEAAYLADRVLIMGPPPNSIRCEASVVLSRPRDRSSSGLRAVMRELRDKLDELPCCVARARDRE